MNSAKLIADLRRQSAGLNKSIEAHRATKQLLDEERAFFWDAVDADDRLRSLLDRLMIRRRASYRELVELVHTAFTTGKKIGRHEQLTARRAIAAAGGRELITAIESKLHGPGVASIRNAAAARQRGAATTKQKRSIETEQLRQRIADAWHAERAKGKTKIDAIIAAVEARCGCSRRTVQKYRPKNPAQSASAVRKAA